MDKLLCQNETKALDNIVGVYMIIVKSLSALRG